MTLVLKIGRPPGAVAVGVPHDTALLISACCALVGNRDQASLASG